MTKEELIAKMASTAGITKVAATTALEAFTGAVTSSLKKGNRVTLVNFGTFTVASTHGAKSAHGRSAEDPGRSDSEVLRGKRIEGGGEVSGPTASLVP